MTPMRSARTRLIGTNLRLSLLLDEGRFDEASRLARDRAWMGPFDPLTGHENVPSHLACRLHPLLDAYGKALQSHPPDAAGARAALERMRRIVDRMR